VKGQSYTLPNGAEGIWNGSGMEVPKNGK
jgi:hypothetical protein